ncbi:MAG: hypothetical protein M3P42_00560 [Actinomycetota bacterium]|nr:hypothetical protein [Actinomycetota bacterium]
MRAALVVVSAVLLAGCGAEDAVEREAAGNADPPTVAELVCSQKGPELLTPVVRAQADGVHVRVRNEYDHEAEFDYEVTRGDTGGGGSVAPRGTSEHLVPFAAEEVSIGCLAEALDRVDLRVVDPDDALKTAELDCAERSGEFVDPERDLRGSNPVALARRYLEGKGLRPTDTVEPAVAIAGELPVVRVVRDGRIVAKVTLDNARPLHTIGTVEACADFAE